MSPTDLVRAAARPLTERPDDYIALLDWIGDARLVLLGEASHGTHEFYRGRARITRRGFDAVAAEADWPDADRVNRFEHCVDLSSSGVAITALSRILKPARIHEHTHGWLQPPVHRSAALWCVTLTVAWFRQFVVPATVCRGSRRSILRFPTVGTILA